MDLNNCYFNCLESNDPDIMKKVQLILFSYGYKWSDKKSKIYKNHGPFIYIRDNYMHYNPTLTTIEPYVNFKLIPLIEILKL